jgi:hypothetical protein
MAQLSQLLVMCEISLLDLNGSGAGSTALLLNQEAVKSLRGSAEGPLRPSL